MDGFTCITTKCYRIYYFDNLQSFSSSLAKYFLFFIYLSKYYISCLKAGSIVQVTKAFENIRPDPYLSKLLDYI